MSRRIQPEVRVLNFFKESPLAVAEMVLALCQAEVKARKPVTRKPRQSKEVTATPNPLLSSSEGSGT